jgi:hypothetical protein
LGALPSSRGVAAEVEEFVEGFGESGGGVLVGEGADEPVRGLPDNIAEVGLGPGRRVVVGLEPDEPGPEPVDHRAVLIGDRGAGDTQAEQVGLER